MFALRIFLIIPRYSPRLSNDAAPAPAEAPPALEHRFDFSGFSSDQLGRRLEELRHQLKENRSQETELRGHVNRATMELHRLQLKMQKLEDRQVEIEAEIRAARQHTLTA
jgi:chromosome segregation ATPase